MASTYSQQQPLPSPPPGSQQQYPSQYPPQQQQQQQYYQQQEQQQSPQRPNSGKDRRGSRSFSFHSDKSHKSNPHHKIDLHETAAEKEAKRLHSKADPTLAMNEAEPGEFRPNQQHTSNLSALANIRGLAAVAAGVKSSLASLREMPQKDAFGNPICSFSLSLASAPGPLRFC